MITLRKWTYRFALHLLLLGLPILIRAQSDSIADEAVAFHPFYMASNGIRLDYDIHLAKNHWLIIGPQFYVAQRSDKDFEPRFSELFGLGGTVYHRIYLNKTSSCIGTYFSYGVSYNYFKLTYKEDNNTYAEESETRINRYGADIVIGYQAKLYDKLIIDFYTGLGGRYSENSFTGTTHKSFNQDMFDYGFTGNVLVIGIRIGLVF